MLTTSEPIETLKAHCPTCDGMRVCAIHGSRHKTWEFEESGLTLNGEDYHYLLECRGCETVFYYKNFWDTLDFVEVINKEDGKAELKHKENNLSYPAKPNKLNEKPKWLTGLWKIDKTLSRILVQTYVALDSGSLILASVGLRTALDRTCELLGINPAQPMAAKVEQLLKGGWIGETEKLTLDVVAEAGNAAAHRGWSPTKDEFRLLATAMEQFIARALISGKNVLGVATGIPAKPKRSKAAPGAKTVP